MREEVYKSSLRLVSAIVVLNLAFGGFLGLMLIEDSATVRALKLPMPDEYNVVVDTIDLTIDGSTLDNGTLSIGANWTVTNGRTCTLIDTNLVFKTDTYHRLWFRVDSGATLELINSTITVETSDNLGSLFENYEWVNWFNSSNDNKARFRRMIPFNMDIVGSGSRLYMNEDSALKWEGELTFSGGANGTIRDSVISSPSAPFSTYDWGVVVHIEDVTNSLSPVVFEDSRIEKSPWFQGIAYVDPNNDGGDPSNTYVMYENHTISNSYVHVINTYWDLDYQNDTSPAFNTKLPANTDDNVNHYPWFVNHGHNALEISAGSQVNFYGLTIDMSETGGLIPPDGSPAINVLDANSDVTIYRWLAVTPVDSANVPLNGVNIVIDTTKTGALAVIVNGLIDEIYCQPAWDYVDRLPHGTIIDAGATLTGTTGISGKLIFPLASDKITLGGWPNSDEFPNGYNIDATYPAPLETVVGLVYFENFPRLFPWDNFVDYIMLPFSFTAPHPDLYPEFITVPPTSELENVMVDLSIKVWNNPQGPPQDASNVQVQFWDGDPTLNTSTKIGETTIPLITSGTNQTVIMNWLATPPGAHTIYVGVDRNWDSPFLDKVIPEEDETNNVITAAITVLERPDLFINGSYVSFVPGNVVVNGTAVQVNAQVLNIGGSTASNVVVNFYEGTAGGPGAYIGQDTINVQPGSSALATTAWTPNVGFHYVWVFVDELPLPNGLILEKDEDNNVASQSIDVKSRPDLNPTITFDPDDPQYEGTVITVQATVANSGGWNVTSAVLVIFYKDDLDNEIGRVIIPLDFEGISIHVNGGQTVSVTWTAEYPPASHDFFVVVDPDDIVDESNELNNMATDTFIVDPRPNLEITSSDITVSDPYPSDGDNVVINFDIHNTGLSDVTDDFYVRIWLDEVGGSGTLLNEYFEILDIPSGTFIPGSYNWNGVTPAGRHDIWVVVDYNNTVAETSETDNAAAGVIVIFKVPSDLIVNNAAYYPGFSPSPGIVIIDGFTSADPYDRDGYTLVEENGLLIIRDSVFKMVGQSEDYEFNIVVKDTGTLRIDEDSFITTEQYLVNIYLFDSAKLYIDGSTTDNKINIIAADNSEVYITEQSAIYGNIFADEATSNVYLRIVNSTLTNKLENIGGGTQVELWGVFIGGAPASDNTVSVSDSAIVYIDWFLTMNIVDVNDAGIVGAQVMWYRSPPWKDTGSQNTGSDGTATFRLRGMNITATSVVSDIGSYIVVSDFTSPYTMMTYYPDANVTLEMTTNKVKTIKYSTVMPDLDPPLFVTYQFSILSVGDTATVTSWVNNTGPSPANDVYVEFDDDAPGEGGWPKTFLNESGIGAGDSWKIVFSWIPQVIGWHNISVYIDPSNLIIEGNESNNFNSTAVFVTPQKADLMIESTDISFTKDPSNPYGPTENDTITVHAIISNIGETNAFPVPELAVAYYIGDSGGPITLIGWGNISGVSAKQSVASSFSWSSTTPPGSYWIWVQVDPNFLVDETLEDNNEAGNTVYIKQYADVTPVGLEFLVNDIAKISVPDTTMVTLKATVQNLGETNAQNVRVTFYDGLGQQIGNTQTIPLITTSGSQSSQTAEVVWEASVDGLSQDHNMSVVVTGVEENIQDNNEISRILTVTLRPILSIVDIDFSDNSPFVGEGFTISAEVTNTGGTAASTFEVDFWDGDPGIGTLIGTKTMSLGINVTKEVNVTVTYNQDDSGAHEINVVVDPLNKVDEANENNNNASEVIVVYSRLTDIIVTTEPPLSNSPYQIGDENAPEPLPPKHRGYILVEAEGILTMTYTTFTVLQSSDYKFNIIVRNNGTFILEKGSTLLTNGPLMKIYLYDDSTLIVRDSLITSSIVEIVASGNSQIIIEESTVGSIIWAEVGSANVMFDATNSSLTQPFSHFGGSSQATFTNVTVPSVQLLGSAQLTVYQWLMAYVRDGAGTGISGSDVNVSNLFLGTEIPDSPKTTGSEGLALFRVLTDILTPTSETSMLSFRVSAEYLYDTILYTGSSNVTFSSYVDDKQNNFEKVDIFLSALKPNLVVDGTLIHFYKGTTERFTVGVGESITIEATIKNDGTAGTTPMTQVLVWFHHKQSPTKSILLGSDIIETPMEPQIGEGIASITWIPTDDETGTAERIWVTVDPTFTVLELQEQDNSDFTTVNIIRPPDLQVSNIKFNTANFQDIDNTTESIEVTILATITNLGTERPGLGLNVTFYSGFPDFDGDMKPDTVLPSGVEYIGAAPVQIASLAQGTSQTVTMTWDTTDKQKGHSIYVYVTDSEDVNYIADQNLENNHDTESFVVFPKPDLEPTPLPPQTESITLLTSDGTVLTTNPQIGQRLTLSATIFNNGQVYIHAVDVTFWDGDPDTNGDLIIDTGATQIGGNATISIPANSPMNASVTWDVAEPDGPITIYVWVNPTGAVIESDPDNNIDDATFTVSFASVALTWTGTLKPKYDVGDTLEIRSWLTFTDTSTGLPNQPYTIRILKNNNQAYGNPFTGNTDNNGNIHRDIPVPTSAGTYHVEIEIDYGGSILLQSPNFKVEEEGGGLPLPFEWIILIIIIAVLVVIFAGVLMARLGVGKLVECGECGSFIHEGDKKCPKCGAVFETDTAKCSECGSWIPVDSKSCPECGAIFAGLEKEKKGYIEKMKVQYAEYVDQFRSEAKADLGTAFNDEEFSRWWKTSPKYVGFEDWLAREEELKKGRTKPCPSCNTVNPESAAICFKCGTVFKKKEEAPAELEKPPKRPPAEVPAKRVARPPAERRGEAPPTVVPKKVVRPPEVVPKKIVKKPPTVVPKKVVKRPPPEEE